MGLPVTVYRWDDVGAPQIANQKPSEIINVLKKCLVDGYGSKTALGWTMPFEDVAKQSVAFRNSITDGSGGYFKIYSRDGNDNDRTLMRIQSAQSMSDIDTLFRPNYKHAFELFDNRFTKWVLIGTSAGFYFICGLLTNACGADQRYDSMFFAGDFESVIQNDPSKFIAISNPLVNGGDNTSSYASGYNDGFQRCVYESDRYWGYSSIRLYDTDNSGNYYNYSFYSPQGVLLGSAVNITPDKNTQVGLYGRIVIQMTSVSTSSTGRRFDGEYFNQSVKSPVVRGYLPAFIVETYPRYSKYDNYDVFEPHLGQNSYLVRSFANLTGNWIGCENWYE
ncbi:hypothetical protein [Shewanella sp. Arc9-LZ]|uniref:hypothetical protein n=1 Tax=Shewanella sp. Arc9-LZ TaxID=2698686 RepID=UPI00137BC190|nr:hypothetical protein [Shewanella sp. Arc9-LZ]QHS13206.1 hypothetical protein GUY17_08820 [Shewanella sp. Arc9-LZ]